MEKIVGMIQALRETSIFLRNFLFLWLTLYSCDMDGIFEFNF